MLSSHSKNIQTAVTFHVGRCGSTVLGEMLDRHPNIRSDTEIYTMAYKPLRASDPTATIEQFTRDRYAKQTAKLPDGSHYLFEVKFFSDLDMQFMPGGLPAYIAFMAEFGMTRAIVLERRNVLRRLVSTIVAIKRGGYQLKTGQTAEIPRVRLNVKQVRLGQVYPLVTLIDKINAEYALLLQLLQQHGIATLKIGYEEHIQSGPVQAYRMICEFLGEEPEDVAPAMQRINDRPLREVLANYDAIARVLKNTPHAWMLDAD